MANIKLLSLIFALFNVFFSYFFLSGLVNAQCQTDPRNQGLISTGVPISPIVSFGNIEEVCISGTDAAYRSFKVPSYQDLEDQFYTLSRVQGTIKKAQNTLPSSGTWSFAGGLAGNGIYLQTSSVALSGATGTGTQVIFIRGNLDITANITYGETGNPASDSASGLIFVTSGNINIGSSVTRINAVLISAGTICSAADFGSGTCLNPQQATLSSPQLIINGGLISINKTDLSTSAIKLARNLDLNNQPAEIINKQPKYLYNLRGLLTRDLVITTEDQRYPITVPGFPSPSPSSTAASGPVICSPIPNPTGILDVQPIIGCISI